MSTSFVSKPTVSSTVRLLPLLVSFDEEIDIRRNLLEIPRYRHLSFENSLQLPSELERIVISGHEQLLSKYYEEVRRPTCRLIGMTDHRFHDPRIDALVYAYLPAHPRHTFLERTIDNALDHIHLIHVREQINERLRGVTREIQELNKIGAALSAEHRLDSLLELILTKSRHITNADAGSLYLVESIPAEAPSEGAAPLLLTTNTNGAGGLPASQLSNQDTRQPAKKRLRFRLAQNDSIDLPFRETTMEIDHKSIAGYVASTGQIVNIDDAYDLPPDVPYSINRKFDEDSGYRTKSILAVPLRDQKDHIVGVLQLINAKRDGRVRLDSLSAVDEQVVSFNNRQQDIVASLGSQAAVAVENSRLYESIQRLFEGFVRASVIAIEARD